MHMHNLAHAIIVKLNGYRHVSRPTSQLEILKHKKILSNKMGLEPEEIIFHSFSIFVQFLKTFLKF